MEEKEEWKDVGFYRGVDFTNCYEVSTLTLKFILK